jgi:hypothetical protein
MYNITYYIIFVIILVLQTQTNVKNDCDYSIS